MARVIAAVGALLAVTAIAAGCGGASLQSIVRHDSAETWGEPNPRILSIESVQLASGQHANVARLQGSFHFQCDAPGCHATRTHYAVLELGDSETGYSGSSRADEAAIAAARNANPRFRIFPDFMFIAVRCTIPAGPGGATSGTCSTGWAPPHGIVFEERWPLSAPAGSRYHATWTVTFGPSNRVTSIRLAGNEPPQLWKTATQPPVPPLSVVRARAELGYLRVFPSFPGTRPCSFAGGGPRRPGRFRGTCTTKLLPWKGNRPVLEFRETWLQGKGTYTGGWIVTLRHDLTVESVRITGTNPPQSWR